MYAIRSYYAIAPVTNITVSGLLVNNVNCNGETDGAVDFMVSNFASTYNYTVNGGLAITGQTSNTINLTGLSVITSYSIHYTKLYDV